MRLVDEWQDVAVEIEARGASQLWISPIETVSESEEGFERVYQGSQILGVWNVTLDPAEPWSAETVFHVCSGARIGQTDAGSPGLSSLCEDQTPQAEACASCSHSAISKLSAKGHSVSIHCESQRKPLRCAIAEISSARYLCELSVQMVSSFRKDTVHPARGMVTI